MDGRKITSEEQHCISDCIRKYWGNPDDQGKNLEHRDQQYERCLTDCQICA